MPAAITTAPDADRLWTIRDVAHFLGVSQRTVHRLKDAGEIPHVRVGHLVRYRADAIAGWAEAQERRAAA